MPALTGRFAQSPLGTGLTPLDVSGSPSMLVQLQSSVVELMMAFFAQHQRFSPSGNHKPLPHYFSMKILQFVHMVDFIVHTIGSTTILTFLCL